MAIDFDGVYAEVGRIVDSAVEMTNDLAARTFVGEAADGRVQATVTGGRTLVEIRFRPRATQEIDNVSLGEAVVQAVNQAEDLAEERRLEILRQHQAFGVDPEAFLRNPRSVIPQVSDAFGWAGRQ